MANVGGRRLRARHPPGARNPALDLPQPLAALPPAAAESPPPAPVDPALLTLISLRAQGLPWAEIGARTNLDPGYCRRWVAAYPELIDREVHRLTDPLHYLEPLIPKAVSTYHEILDDATVDPKVHFDAARDVLDRRFGKPTIRQESVSLQGIVIEVRSRSQG